MIIKTQKSASIQPRTTLLKISNLVVGQQQAEDLEESYKLIVRVGGNKNGQSENVQSYCLPAYGLESSRSPTRLQPFGAVRRLR